MADVAWRVSGIARSTTWRGRSGRSYALLPQRLDSLALEDDVLHLLTLGTNVLWAGTARDVVNDAESRARFRLALDCADRAFAVDAGGTEVERMTIVWDLETAEPVSELSAA